MSAITNYFPRKAQKWAFYCKEAARIFFADEYTTESGGIGLAYDEDSIAAIERGIQNVIHHLRMLDGAAPVAASPHWIDPSEVLRFPEEGLKDKFGTFYPKAVKGQEVLKGAVLGHVTNIFGVCIIGTPAINAGEPLAFIGAAATRAP